MFPNITAEQVSVLMKRPVESFTELNDDLYNRTVMAIWRTWQAIGWDIEQNCGELTNIEAIEIVLDADHVSIYGQDPDVDKIITRLFRNHSVEDVLNFYAKRMSLA